MDTAWMKPILAVRERIIVFFKAHEAIILFIAKLCAGFLIFGIINKIGLYDPVFEGIVSLAGGLPYIALLAVFFTILPPTAGNLLILLAAVLQISQTIEIASIVFLLGVCVLVFYSRLEPKKSYLIIAVVFGFYFKMPYIAVLFAGLYVGLAGIIPITIGAAIWNFIPLFGDLAKSVQTPDVIELTELNIITDSLADIYGTIYARATTDLQWLFTAFIFVMVIILVYAVSRLSINYAKEIAVALGGVLCVFGAFMAAAVAGIGENPGISAFYAVLSAVFVLLIKFFDLALDYKKVEHVQFEDEENYYYVKIVSKINVPKAKEEPVRRPARPRQR